MTTQALHTCRICEKPIEGAYLPAGDLESYLHPACYVTAWRHERNLSCGDPLCVQCGDPRDNSVDVARLSKCDDCGHALSEHEDVAADLREPTTWVCHGGDYDCGCKERAMAGGWAGCEHFCRCSHPAAMARLALDGALA